MASVRDILFIAVIFFALGIGMLVLHNVSSTIFNSMQHSAVNESDTAVIAIQNAEKVNTRFDMVMTTVFIGLCLTIMITGWLVGGHAIFMFIYFLVVVVGVILSAILANVWESVTVVPVLALSVSALPITNHIISALPYYVAVVGTIGIIVMFAKPNERY
jgi:hypothetical protein